MQYDVGIILSHAYGPFGFSSRQKRRMNKGIELLKTDVVKFLMTTGGKGKLFNLTPNPLGQLVKNYLVKNGVDESKILVEDNSQNTYQNAKYTLSLMKKNNLSSAIIITSADHLPRAKAIFKDVFPHKFKIDFMISDFFSGLWTIWDFFWHIAGWIRYKIKNTKRA